MIIEYQIRDNDTIQRIAQRFYKDPNRWLDIAKFNELDYPYITADQDFRTEVKASNLVTFQVSAPLATDKTIPMGTRLLAPGTERAYRVLVDTVLLAGSLSVSVMAECEFAGIWGNTGVGTITAIDPATPVTNVTVTNSVAFTNGAIYQVKKTGDILLILVDDSQGQTYATQTEYFEVMGGMDISMAVDVDSYGDLPLVAGADNIVQALRNRLETERGELAYHPSYGSNLQKLLGRNDPFITKLMAIDVVETVLQDERIASVDNLGLQKVGTQIHVTCNIIMAGQDKAQSIGMTLF